MGFPIVKTGKDFFGYWGRHIAPNRYGPIKHFQMINHFPLSFEAGRKDKMYVNWLKMKARMERSEQANFQYCPETFILPGDRRALKRNFSSQSLWIVKPPASARGLGIKVISSWAQVPKKKPVIVSRYISNPLLIQKRKFDLRLYVLVTSFDPLRIYLYEEGVVRFAAEPYRASVTSKKLKNKFIHLTNYSISKKKKAEVKEVPVDASDPFNLRDNKWYVFTVFIPSSGTNVCSGILLHLSNTWKIQTLTLMMFSKRSRRSLSRL